MYTVKSSSEFIADIRALDEKLKNVRMSSIEVDRDKKSIRYNFICDQAIGDELRGLMLAEVEKITAPAFSEVSVSVKKIVSNDELINQEIYQYLSKYYPSISIFLKPTDVRSVVVGELVRYTLRLTKDGSEYVKRNGALNKLNEFLAKKFCSDFVGDTEIKEAEETLSLLTEEVFEGELQKIEHRTIKVENVIVIDDFNMGELALYIEDMTAGEVTVCGNITEISERKTKNDKPFYIIHLDDTTGTTSGIYFTKKSTCHKIKELQVGDTIIVRGNLGEYNGKPSFTIDKINRCTFPKDFVKKDKYKKTVPKEYKTIFPAPAKTVKIKSVFDMNEVLPDELTASTYVVFDLETTGLDVMNNGITEIGAVKLENGAIVEEFTSLIKPDYKITAENTAITGITEEMVKDCPKIGAVIPDFIKFIDGAVLVAQNAEFDMKFLKRFAGAEDYEIKNKVLDTLELARSNLPMLKRHDLHTLAEHFGIVFHHHRALSDAYCTADVFIELMKIKNNR